jgi:uncharacterized protein (TIGR03032 family)
MHPPPTGPGPLTCHATEGFTAWMAAGQHSLAVSTYQANLVLLLGWDGRQLTVLPRAFDKPMGMAVDGNRMALATRHDLILLADAPLLAHEFLPDHPGRYDGLLLPRLSYHTGDLHTHDVAFGRSGLWLVNTRFSCLAGPSESYAFEPRWKPPFISVLAPEDRCHLNGLAMVDGEPGFVTALGESDTVGGWRPTRANGGVVVHVPSGEVVLRGLSMPHSPRWHDGRLYLLNSGEGELIRMEDGRAEVICRLPGYLRGLCLFGRYALVGICQIRERHIFGELPVQKRVAQLRCGVSLVDVATGRELGMFEITDGCTELFEVRVLEGRRRPMILNRERPESKEAFPAPDFSYWLRPQNQIPDSPR